MKAMVAFRAFLILWYFGLIFFGKAFAYLNLFGILYVSEFVLFILVLTSLKKLYFFDFIYLMLGLLFVVAGWLKHGSLSFAYKDMVWYFYIYFLRCFPRNYPPVFYKSLFLCLQSILVVDLLRVLRVPPMVSEFYIGYRIFPATLALSLVAYARRFIGSLSVFVGNFLLAVLISFKSAMLVTLLIPLLLRAKAKTYRNIVSYLPKVFIVLAMFSIFFPYFNQSAITFGLEFINSVGNAVFEDFKDFNIGTSRWRYLSWEKASEFLLKDFNYILGYLPGINPFALFPELSVEGSVTNQLGINRSLHNIALSAVFHTGFLGFFMWLYAIHKMLKDSGNLAQLFFLICLVLSLTSAMLDNAVIAALVYFSIGFVDYTQAQVAALKESESEGEGEVAEGLGTV